MPRFANAGVRPSAAAPPTPRPAAAAPAPCSQIFSGSPPSAEAGAELVAKLQKLVRGAGAAEAEAALRDARWNLAKAMQALRAAERGRRGGLAPRPLEWAKSQVSQSQPPETETPADDDDAPSAMDEDEATGAADDEAGEGDMEEEDDDEEEDSPQLSVGEPSQPPPYAAAPETENAAASSGSETEMEFEHRTLF